uniref:AAA family ATPase n=1 Tax=Prevotella sp. GTC17259 TaxID=3236795 RepID=A0AB33J4L2_9BACT
MIIDEIKHEIVQAFGFEPTADQRHALNVFAQFLSDRSPAAVMILRGSAGTGKTSLAGAIVRTMKKLRQRVLLLAPTGRAAKVFALNSEHEAYTIHRRIYREKAYEGLDGQFNLNRNTYRDTLFMVDEASMIANQGLTESSFGTGRLLDDLIKFVYEGENDRLLLIGDKAQLPPVGEMESPALNAQRLAGYGLRVYECDLDEVLRQGDGSGILYNATTIRRMITLDAATAMPKVRFRDFADIAMLPGKELVDALASSYSHVGMDETTVITRSNKRANIYNQGIRGSVLDREDVLNTGDLLMIVKNNYYWVGEENARAGEGEKCPMSFIANGDRAVVLKVRNIRDLYGFSFADVLLRFPDYDDYEMQTTVVLDSLTTESPALTREQNERLYQGVMEDYADLSTKTARLAELRKDVYFNALQIKYGYSFTCHKAQGGQWSHVYIDQGYMTDDMLTADYIHWLYTAFTRATEKLFLVNWPKSQIEE